MATLNQTTQEVKQKHGASLAAEKTFRPRNQAAKGQTPDNLLSDLQSIANNIGSVAQDTYQLNEGIAKRVGLDHLTTSIKEIENIDKNLGLTDNRDDAINTVAKLYSDKVTATNKFDGNEDMQRAYSEAYIEPVKRIAARQMTKWQKENNEINKAKALSHAEDAIATLSSDDKIKAEDVAVSVQTIKDSLKPHDIKSDTYVDTRFAISLTKSLVAELQSDTDKFFKNGGVDFIYNINSEKFDQEKTSELFNKKYSLYATMDEKGVITYKTEDANVQSEIQKGWAGFQHSVRQAAKGTKEKHTKSYNYIVDSITTAGIKHREVEFAGNRFNVGYIGSMEEARAYANQTFYTSFGMYPTTDQEEYLLSKFNKKESELNDMNSVEYYSQNLIAPVDESNFNDKKILKGIYESRASSIMGEYNNSYSVIQDENATNKDKNKARFFIADIVKMTNNSSHMVESSKVISSMSKEIFTNPTSSTSYESYMKYRDVVRSKGGSEYLRQTFKTTKDYNKAKTYMMLYDKHMNSENADQPFAISIEKAGIINKFADGGYTEKEYEIINSFSLVDDVRKESKYSTSSEIDDQIAVTKLYKLIDQDGEYEITASQDGENIYSNEDGDASFKANTDTKSISSWSRYMANYVNDKGEKSYLKNLKLKVLGTLFRNGYKKESSQLVDKEFVLQEVEGSHGLFKVFTVEEGQPLYDMSITIDLSNWNGEKDTTLDEEKQIRQQNAADKFRDAYNLK